MMALFWFLTLAAVVLAIIGLAADGMIYLLVIGIVVLVADLLLLGLRVGRRGRNRPTR